MVVLSQCWSASSTEAVVDVVDVATTHAPSLIGFLGDENREAGAECDDDPADLIARYFFKLGVDNMGGVGPGTGELGPDQKPILPPALSGLCTSLLFWDRGNIDT